MGIVFPTRHTRVIFVFYAINVVTLYNYSPLCGLRWCRQLRNVPGSSIWLSNEAIIPLQKKFGFQYRMCAVVLS